MNWLPSVITATANGEKCKSYMECCVIRLGFRFPFPCLRGNTTDTKTFGSQIQKVAQRFGGGAVTFVGIVG